jgi:hypothetical protein
MCYARLLYTEEINSEYVPNVSHDSYSKLKGIRNSEHINDDITFGISIPTWEQVFEWFINKGLVAVIATAEVLNEGDPQYYSSVDDIKKGGYYHDIGYAKTYEEARELALNKLIELYENK